MRKKNKKKIIDLCKRFLRWDDVTEEGKLKTTFSVKRKWVVVRYNGMTLLQCPQDHLKAKEKLLLGV